VVSVEKGEGWNRTDEGFLWGIFWQEKIKIKIKIKKIKKIKKK
jgi:hypothetical protein